MDELASIESTHITTGWPPKKVTLFIGMIHPVVTAGTIINPFDDFRAVVKDELGEKIEFLDPKCDITLQ